MERDASDEPIHPGPGDLGGRTYPSPGLEPERCLAQQTPRSPPAMASVRHTRQDPPPTPPAPLAPAPPPQADGAFAADPPAEPEAGATGADDLRFPINLATALRLSDARPLVVAAAQASVWVAEAQLTRAKVLWVPTLMFGFDYIRHDGGGPDFNKGIMTAPSVNFFYGGGGLSSMST